MINRTEEFKAELFALLNKYGVEVQVEEATYGYGTVVEGINFSSENKYCSETYDRIEEGIDFTLGSFIDGTGE